MSVVMTVAGPIDADAVGVTLVHEHLHMDARSLLTGVHGYGPSGNAAISIDTAAEARWSPGASSDNYDLTDPELVVAELAPFVAAGGRTIVDLTPVGLGRSPVALQRIARAAGINVVMGTGYYLASTHPQAVQDATPEQLADEFVREFRGGADGTEIRPGIMGELGTGTVLHGSEAKVLRAAAWAQPGTGAPISVHLHPWSKVGHDVLDVLLREQARPERIVLGHLHPVAGDLAYVRSLLDRGVYGAFDLFGFDHSLLATGRYPPSDHDVVAAMHQLILDGYGSRLLASQDVGVRTRLHRFGGWGYDHILTHVVPLMRSQGWSSQDIGRLLVDNPRDILTLDPARTAADIVRATRDRELPMQRAREEHR